LEISDKTVIPIVLERVLNHTQGSFHFHTHHLCWNILLGYVHQENEQKRYNANSEELYKVSEAFSTHIIVGKGDNITMKMSKQIQEKKKLSN
jgi:hypothetical protein